MSGTNSLVIGYNEAFPDQFVNGAFYYTLGGFLQNRSPTEALCQSEIVASSAASNLAVRIGATNTYGSGAASQVFRKGGVTGSQSVAIGGAGANVWIVDSTHSDSLVSGNLYCAAFVANSGGPDCNVGLVQCQLNATLPTVTYLVSGNFQSTPTWSVSAAASQYFPIFGGPAAGSATEILQAETAVRSAGSFSGLAVTIGNYLGTAAFRKNGSSGNQSVTFPGGASVVVTDTTHSDTASSGDLVDTLITGGATTGASPTAVGYTFAGSTSKHDLGATANATAITASATLYTPFGGAFSTAGTTETQAKQVLPYALTASNLRVSVTLNTLQTFTLNSRKNGAGGNQSAAVSSATTGVVEDVTHTDSYSASDAMNGQGIAGSGTAISISAIMASVNDGSNSGHGTETGTASLAFAGVSFASSASHSLPSTASMAFGGVAFAATASHQLQIAGALAFKGVAFAATASGTHIASGDLTFHGVSFAGSVTDYTAIAALHFAGVSFSAAAAASHVAGGALHFAGLAFAGVGGTFTTAEIAEAFISVLAVGTPVAEIAEAYIGALVTIQAGAQIAEAFVSSLVYRGPCGTQRADLWKITRTDGRIFAFTSLDTGLTYGGVDYQHCASLADSASENGSEVGSVGSVTLTGILDDDSITDADIYAGKFDDAFVEVWVVNWGPEMDPAAPFRVAAGWMGKLSFGQITWTGEVLGPGAKMKQTAVVDFYTPGCGWEFGVLDSDGIGCPVDATALAASDLNLTGAKGRTTLFFDGTMPVETAIWDQGKVIWTYGVNAGVECQVYTVDWSTNTILLWDPCPFPPDVGDIFTLQPGCPKDTASCQTYNVYDSFGGFPDVPGPDALQQSASSLFTGGAGT